jgi:hypothetical protein
MKIAELLRSLADKLENIEKGGITSDLPANAGPTGDHFQHDVNDGAKSGDKDVEVSAVMVPPLQQKLEILKKLSGEADQPDELNDIKRLTGIQTVIHADDADLDGQ